MENNIIKKIASSVAGTALSLAVIVAGAAEAATFNFDFHDLNNTLDLGGGSLSFDDESLTGNGSGELGLGNLVNANFYFDFNYLSSALDETNLVSDPTFSFVDGELTGLTFFAQKQNPPSEEIENLFVVDLDLNFVKISSVDGGYQTLGQVSFETVTAWQPPDTTDPPDTIDPPEQVPEPTAVAGLVLLGLGGLLRRSAQSASKS